MYVYIILIFPLDITFKLAYYYYYYYFLKHTQDKLLN